MHEALTMLPAMQTAGETTVAESLREQLWSRLLAAQNPDGGWGYQAGRPSAAEPTAWALLGLRTAAGERLPQVSPRMHQARHWLEQQQTDQGFWTTPAAAIPGIWVTALAGLALAGAGGSAAALSRAAQWLVATWPAEGRLRWNPLWWWRGRRVTEQNPALRGWSWIPGTASWVEPTAVTLLFLNRLLPALRPAATERRVRLATAMLYDRMCPSGGWNSGNPRIYGVEGVPQIGPTAWALLALAERPERERARRSLDWLERAVGESAGVSSLALAALALRAWRRSSDWLEPALVAAYQREPRFSHPLALAQALMALTPGAEEIFCARGQPEG